MYKSACHLSGGLSCELPVVAGYAPHHGSSTVHSSDDGIACLVSGGGGGRGRPLHYLRMFLCNLVPGAHVGTLLFPDLSCYSLRGTCCCGLLTSCLSLPHPPSLCLILLMPPFPHSSPLFPPLPASLQVAKMGEGISLEARLLNK